MVENTHKLMEEAHILFHPLRFRMAELLRKEPMHINALAKAINVERRLASYHLLTLEQYGLVRSEYEISDNPKSRGKAIRKYWITDKVVEVMAAVKKL